MSNFFDEMTVASDVKATIVEKYFSAWSTIMKTNPRVTRLGYIDLFCGPGRYTDGKESTPLKILNKCITDAVLSKKIVTLFNDSNEIYARKLTKEMESLNGVNNLTHKPQITNFEVGDEFVSTLAIINMFPCLSFVDPWGYKGLSIELINTLSKDWGSDVIFFFNYNRINTAICNQKVETHIDALFTRDKADLMRGKLGGLSAQRREELVLKELSAVLKGGSANYVLPFRFVAKDKNKTSHYIIFLTKSQIGYKIMKEIMWKASSSSKDGVAEYAYIPDVYLPTEPLYAELFEFAKPLDELADELTKRFAGKTISVKQIYEEHNHETPYVLANYKEALRRLERDNRIRVRPPANHRQIRNGVLTMSEKVMVSFPK